MRIVVITSCTGEKAATHKRSLKLRDFRKGKAHVKAREQELASLMLPAEALYTGQQHVRLMRGVEAFRERFPKKDGNPTLDLYVLSAGYGLVPGRRKLAPYETTFQGMKRGELRSWADELGAPAAFRKVLRRPYDLALVLLGDAYLDACAPDADTPLGGPTLLFCGTRQAKKLPRIAGLRATPMSNPEARRFSCGLVALKGELATRLLGLVAEEPDLIQKLRDPATDVLARLDMDAPAPTSSSKRASAVANPAVDHVIDIPKAWLKASQKRKLRYFIPEWDDLVDPDYDFENDIHSGGSGDWSNEVYAHQMYAAPNYDGLLMSKVVAEKSKKKKARINEMGVHRYFRVPRSFPVMGDCGAFGYINEDVPPYTTSEILDYYTRLDFDFGVSIDHLVVKSTQAQQKERYQLTIANAETFLKEHRARRLSWTPIGAVQGWDARTYAEGARACVAMGYDYLGLGGLVRTNSREILQILEAVHEVVPAHVSVHLFGLSRISTMKKMSDLGVTSVDSASLLRRAWMGTGQNYITEKGVFYTAIRVPEAGKSFRAKRMVEEGRATQEQVARLDKKCRRALRNFDRGKASVQSVLDTLGEYDQMITPERADTTDLLRHTLEDAPWKQCGCEICQTDGIEVVIFRGNNRNRRRGFHNTYVFYRLLERALNGEPIAFSRVEAPSPQLTFPELTS